jgi:hypothetical protein
MSLWRLKKLRSGTDQANRSTTESNLWATIAVRFRVFEGPKYCNKVDGLRDLEIWTPQESSHYATGLPQDRMAPVS